MITQDKDSGEIKLEDHPVRVEFLIHRGGKFDPRNRVGLTNEIAKNTAAILFLESLGYSVEDFEVRVIMQ